MFKFENIKDFDKHIDNSIPNYKGLIDIIVPIANEYLAKDGDILDLGCSKGTTLNLIETKGRKIGVDTVDMGTSNIEFVNMDILEYLEGLTYIPDVILSIFTLQFLGDKKRASVIDHLSNLVKSGSKLIIAEKVYIGDSRLNNLLNRLHIQTKRDNFTDTEILDKDDQLFGSMFPKNNTELEIELSEIGNYVQIWQSYNFKAWVVM